MANSDQNRMHPDVFEQIWTIKQEVDALQIAAAREHKPWYKSVSTIIAAAALLISVVSSVGNHYRNVDLDQYRLRDELRSNILRLSALPFKHIELQEKYINQPLLQGSISSLIGAENALLVSRGVEIIDQIPQLVSDSERVAIANALLPMDEIGRAKELFETVARKSNSAADATAAYRQLAALSFQIGNVEEGRKHFSDAIDMFKRGRFPSSPPATVNVTNALTEMFWAQEEAIVGNCKEWQRHLVMAERIGQLIAADPEHPINKQIVETRAYGCPPRNPKTRGGEVAPDSIR